MVAGIIVLSLGDSFAHDTSDTPQKKPVYIATFFPRQSPFSHSQIKNRLNQKKMSQKIESVNNEKYRAFLKRVRPVIDLIEAMGTEPEPRQKVLTFWQLGEQIYREKTKHAENSAYLTYLTEALHADSGISQQTLGAIELLYRRYNVAATLSPQLSWDHYCVLMTIDDTAKRSYYQNLAIMKKWTPDELDNQVRENTYELKSHPETTGHPNSHSPGASD